MQKFKLPLLSFAPFLFLLVLLPSPKATTLPDPGEYCFAYQDEDAIVDVALILNEDYTLDGFLMGAYLKSKEIIDQGFEGKLNEEGEIIATVYDMTADLAETEETWTWIEGVLNNGSWEMKEIECPEQIPSEI